MLILNKKGIRYYQKENGTIYCDPLDQSGKVGGTGEEDRNDLHNAERVELIKKIISSGDVLDYGCGKGKLVKKLLNNGINATGYDKYSEGSVFIGNIPNDIFKFDLITMIEVIEHLSDPYSELDEVFDYLKEGGFVIIETSFVDWMRSDDPYINPEIGHSTIFSHAGLDELMIDKGFVPSNHINRNIRLYRKPKKEERPIFSLVIMSQGNPIALRRTLENTKGIVSEVIFGDVAIFEEDKVLFRSYAKEFNIKIIELPFNYLFKEGFSSMLNLLASHATNDLCLYLNVGEIITIGKENIYKRLNSKYNAYYQIHPVEKHHWVRFWNRKEMSWAGRLHEECAVGNLRLCPTPIFTFEDSEKDMDNHDYAAAMNTTKEMTYFKNLIEMVDNPDSLKGTHPSWIQYAKDSYESLKERLHRNENRYIAFETTNKELYISTLSNDNNSDFESSTLINFQGNRKDIL
jgi:SAM-dependent methyltransferase